MMSFVQVWLSGYTHPLQLGERLEGKQAPHWGFYAQLLRALLDSFLLFMPLALLKRQPSTPSYLSFLPTGRYYQAAVWFMPLFLLAQWLLMGVIVHLVLRLIGRRSDVDQILNLTGMSALVVGAFLVLWDWGFLLLGGQSDPVLGISHLVLDTWGILITVSGLKRMLGVPVWLGLALNLLYLSLGVPLAMIFARGPL